MATTRTSKNSTKRTSNNSTKTSVKNASQKMQKLVKKKNKTKVKSLSHKKDDPKIVMEYLNDSEPSSDDEKPTQNKRKQRKKKIPNPSITTHPLIIDGTKAKNTHDVASAAAAAAAAAASTATAAVTGTSGGTPVNTTTIVAAVAAGEDAVDNASLDAASSSALVNAPTTTTTITTKNKKTKGFLDTSGFPVLQDGSFAVSFYLDGSNKLVIKPSHPPGMGCLHCGKELNSFGNIAHHVTDTYPRMIDSTNGSKGELSKKTMYTLELVLMGVI